MPNGRDFFFQSGAGGGGSSSGQGGINYITNYGFEENASDWATYADAAAATPADGTGGSPTSTLTRTTTAAEVLRGVGAGKFAKPASNEQGEGFSYDFTLDVQDYDGSKPLYVAFDYMTSAAYVSGDIRVFVYDKDGAALLNVLSVTGDGSVLPATDPSRFVGAFYSTSGNNDYRLIFHVTSTNASAYDFVIDNVSVSPQATVPGAIVTAWESWTPTGSWSTNTTYAGRKRRVGGVGEYEVLISLAGAPTTATLTVNMPSAEVIDTAQLTTTTTLIPVLGSATCRDEGTKDYPNGIVRYVSTTSVDVRYLVSDTANPVYGANVTQAAPFTFGNTDKVILRWSAPIVGWLPSAALSTTETMLSTVQARYTTNTASSIASGGSASIVDYEDKDYDTHNAVTTGASWKFTSPRTGYYSVKMANSLSSSAGWADGEFYYAQLFKNGSVHSLLGYQEIQATGTVGLIIVGSASVYLAKGDYIDVRLFQNSGGAIALDTTPSNNYVAVEEQPDFSIFSVYGIGQVVEAGAALGNYGITADQFGDLTSISLTPGEWDIHVQGFFFSNGATTTTRIDLGVSSTSGNSATGLVAADTLMSGTKATASGTYQNISLLKRAVTVTSTTTYYLKARAATSITNLQAAYMISARRIK